MLRCCRRSRSRCAGFQVEAAATLATGVAAPAELLQVLLLL
jgi:hypothetical protein